MLQLVVLRRRRRVSGHGSVVYLGAAGRLAAGASRARPDRARHTGGDGRCGQSSRGGPRGTPGTAYRGTSAALPRPAGVPRRVTAANPDAGHPSRRPAQTPERRVDAVWAGRDAGRGKGGRATAQTGGRDLHLNAAEELVVADDGEHAVLEGVRVLLDTKPPQLMSESSLSLPPSTPPLSPLCLSLPPSSFPPPYLGQLAPGRLLCPRLISGPVPRFRPNTRRRVGPRRRMRATALHPCLPRGGGGVVLHMQRAGLGTRQRARIRRARIRACGVT